MLGEGAFALDGDVDDALDDLLEGRGGLFVSPLTVRTLVHRAMTKPGARDRAQLVVMACQSGLVRAVPPHEGR